MLTQRLAEFVTQTPTSDIPATALEGAQLAISDTLACARGHTRTGQ